MQGMARLHGASHMVSGHSRLVHQSLLMNHPARSRQSSTTVRASKHAGKKGSPHVLVLGAGVNGLASALRLLQAYPGIGVTIVAHQLGQATVSAGAAGIWGPYKLWDTPTELSDRWAGQTLEHLYSLLHEEQADEAGVALMGFHSLLEESEVAPSWSSLVDNWSALGSRQLSRINAVRTARHAKSFIQGWFHHSIVCEGSSYLPWLTRQIEARGGRLVTTSQPLTSLSQLLDPAIQATWQPVPLTAAKGRPALQAPGPYPCTPLEPLGLTVQDVLDQAATASAGAVSGDNTTGARAVAELPPGGGLGSLHTPVAVQSQAQSQSGARVSVVGVLGGGAPGAVLSSTSTQTGCPTLGGSEGGFIVSVVPHLVINCAGLGAHQLLGDKAVQPIRGHVLRVIAPWMTAAWFGGEQYIIPNRSTVVLGGTGQVGDWDTSPRVEDRLQILRGCLDMQPSLASAQVVGDWVGLRPGRTSVRLELDPVPLTSAPKPGLSISTGGSAVPVPVVHCYGHGGAGLTLAWGCAGDVVQLVGDTLDL